MFEAEGKLSFLDIEIAPSKKWLVTHALIPHTEKCGVKRVIISVLVKEPSCLNVVLGYNHGLLGDGEKKIITNASCTTNCLAPVVKIVKEKFGIAHRCITTIHDVTETQVSYEKSSKWSYSFHFLFLIFLHCFVLDSWRYAKHQEI